MTHRKEKKKVNKQNDKSCQNGLSQISWGLSPRKNHLAHGILLERIRQRIPKNYNSISLKSA